MEKHRCKLCFKSFSNGRALGGHMRSHMLNLPIPPRHEEEEEEERPQEPNQLSDGDTESGSLSSSSSDEEGGGGEKGNLCYGLRENPKRSFRLVDPEFSFTAAAAAAVDAGSVVLQDRESETESSKNPTRRRSKRTRKLDHHHHHQFHHHHQYHHQQQQQENGTKKLKFHKLSKTTESSTWAHEPEPVSSISDTTTEEDVAFCLMMLSRDKWKRKEQQQRRRQVFIVDQDQDEEEAEAEAEKSMEETDESDEFIKSCKNRSRVGKYRCDTCKKVFKSYQALGGHRASHKKIKFYNNNTTTATATAQTTKQTESEQQENAGTSIATPMLEKTNKVHECPVCFRVFSSGQALGGHKRTHVTGLVAATTTTSTTPARTQHHVTSTSTKFGDNLIDLNLPAPVDDDDISQIELSAVSDAEFVNHIKR
ncbi:hypothetical protein Dsin_026407 [Dipteronia sinensis]|uniref:C2H2-type domain-containing protein n=1 Tax=Dipteronia sinensis TaxID=43782 RepID=A0AAD9ZXJ8_9ROSI|nr:hypothetical protein Dsin_026407 [Dipteronia sinensis]